MAKSTYSADLVLEFRKKFDEAHKLITGFAESHHKTIVDTLSGIVLNQIIASLVIIIGATSIGFWYYAEIVKPIRRIKYYMQQLAKGDHDNEVAYLDRKDEIGEMAQSVQFFKDAALEKARLEAEALETQAALDEERVRREMVNEQNAKVHDVFVKSFGQALERLANGDLAHRLQTAFADNYEKLRNDFNQSVEKLQRTMLDLKKNSHDIRSGSESISSAADEMSQRTERQAARLQETAAALDEITETVKKTAEGATFAREVVSRATEDAERAGGVVRQAIQAMGGIEKSSQQISQIIGVIDEIAFQTNLLALNAGVEAARAGEAGRGFAVVATEVRALAQRSADAAKEIKSLIAASNTKVDQGVDLVGRAGEALQRIVAQVCEMNGVIANIAEGAGEQAVNLQQVNSAINEMDHWTQQSAVMVEQSAQGTHSLAEESETLVRLVSQFQLGEAIGAKPASSPVQKQPKRQTVLRAVVSTGEGAAVRKSEPVTVEEGWEEF